MLITTKYDRDKAVAYAIEWAFRRNPKYYNFTGLGGDCTNYISQCIYAGSGVMNYKPVYGWFYNSPHSRTASWSGVVYLYNFLVNNTEEGPYAKVVELSEAQVGDVIQLGNEGNHFYHSLFITKINGKPSPDNILVSTHSYDAENKPLSTYIYAKSRCLQIEGVRKYQK